MIEILRLCIFAAFVRGQTAHASLLAAVYIKTPPPPVCFKRKEKP